MIGSKTQVDLMSILNGISLPVSAIPSLHAGNGVMEKRRSTVLHRRSPSPGIHYPLGRSRGRPPIRGVSQGWERVERNRQFIKGFRKSPPPTFSGAGRARISGGFTVFITNLPFDCSKADIGSIFGKYGKVMEVYQPTFPGSLKPRGYAFVRFSYEDDARVAIGVLNGKRIDGRLVTVQATILKTEPRKVSKAPTAPPPIPLAQNPHPTETFLRINPLSIPPNRQRQNLSCSQQTEHQSTSTARMSLALVGYTSHPSTLIIHLL
ncbi:serine/arginine-rich splicing factor SR45-like [Magnolia sinica]|uniref:serine/arginine-rich splicing factor SR45-like n=1 Tax=Magnolia sinica TaxID=86752 RepID=UPI002658A24D|nr:serine/arginine-rich splicing factor SR45-like [Magnolia sinica]